jgi:hypothetical protein
MLRPIMMTVISLVLLSLLAACGSSNEQPEVADPEPLTSGGDAESSAAAAALEERLGSEVTVLGEPARLDDGAIAIAFTVALEAVCGLDEPAPPTDYCSQASATSVGDGATLASACRVLGVAKVVSGAVDKMLFLESTSVCVAEGTATFATQDVDGDEEPEAILDVELVQLDIVDGTFARSMRTKWRHVITYGPDLQVGVEISRVILTPHESDQPDYTPRSWEGTLEVRDDNGDERPDLVLSRQLYDYPCTFEDASAGQRTLTEAEQGEIASSVEGGDMTQEQADARATELAQCPLVTDTERYLYDHTVDHYVEQPAIPGD